MNLARICYQNRYVFRIMIWRALHEQQLFSYQWADRHPHASNECRQQQTFYM